MSPVDYDAAIEAGGTPEEIGRYLSDRLGGHYDAAIEAGGTPEEIGRYLSTKLSFAPTVESGDEEPVRAEHRSGFWDRMQDAAEYGYKGSVTGKAEALYDDGRGSGNPQDELAQPQGFAERAVSGAAGFGGDVPTFMSGMAAGSVAGAPLAGAVATIPFVGPFVAGGVETASSFAGGSAATAAAKEALDQELTDGSINDIGKIVKTTLKEGTVGAIAGGLGGKVGELAIGSGYRALMQAADTPATKKAIYDMAKAAGEVSWIGEKIARPAVEAAAMPVASAGMEGRIPTFEEMVDSGIQIAGMNMVHGGLAKGKEMISPTPDIRPVIHEDAVVKEAQGRFDALAATPDRTPVQDAELMAIKDNLGNAEKLGQIYGVRPGSKEETEITPQEAFIMAQSRLSDLNIAGEKGELDPRGVQEKEYLTENMQSPDAIAENFGYRIKKDATVDENLADITRPDATLDEAMASTFKVVDSPFTPDESSYHYGEETSKLAAEIERIKAQRTQSANDLGADAIRQEDVNQYNREKNSTVATADEQAQADQYHALMGEFSDSQGQIQGANTAKQAVHAFNRSIPDSTMALPLDRNPVPVGGVEPIVSAVKQADAQISPLQSELAAIRITAKTNKLVEKAEEKIALGAPLTKGEQQAHTTVARADALASEIARMNKNPAKQADDMDLHRLVQDERKDAELQNARTQTELYQPEVPVAERVPSDQHPEIVPPTPLREAQLGNAGGVMTSGAGSFVSKYKAASEESRKDMRDMIGDQFAMAKEKGRKTEHYTSRLALMREIDKGEAPNIDAIHSNQVEGHPENTSHQLTQGLIPYHVKNTSDVERKLDYANDVFKAANGKLAQAEYALAQAKTTAAKRKAQAEIKRLSDKEGIHRDSVDALRNETIPELERMYKAAKEAFGESQPVATKPPSQPENTGEDTVAPVVDGETASDLTQNAPELATEPEQKTSDLPQTARVGTETPPSKGEGRSYPDIPQSEDGKHFYLNAKTKKDSNRQIQQALEKAKDDSISNPPRVTGRLLELDAAVEKAELALGNKNTKENRYALLEARQAFNAEQMREGETVTIHHSNGSGTTEIPRNGWALEEARKKFGGTEGKKVLFSESTNESTGNTVSSVVSELKSFLGRGYDKMVGNGRIEVVRTEMGLPENMQKVLSPDGRVVGAYDPATKKTWLVADMIKPGDAEYVMRHEGVHAVLREDPIFMKAKDGIISDFMGRAELTPSIKEAIAQVPKDTPEALKAEEALSYWMQNPANHVHSLYKRIVSAVKNALFRMGVPFKNLTDSDLSSFFTKGVKDLANREGTVKDSLTAGEAEPALFSKASDLRDKVIENTGTREAIDTLKDIATGVQKTAFVGSLNPSAKKVQEILVEGMGTSQMNRERLAGDVNRVAESYRKDASLLARTKDLISTSTGLIADTVFNPMTDKEKIDFIYRHEKNMKQATNELQEISNVLRDMFKQKEDEVKALDTGALQRVVENYFPHIWKKKSGEDRQVVNSILTNTKLGGTKSFTKKRIFEDVQKGIDAGYELISTNPLDLAFLKLAEMDKYINLHRGLQEVEGKGLAIKLKIGSDAPNGFEKLDSPFGVVVKDDIPSTRRKFTNELQRQGRTEQEANAIAQNMIKEGIPFTEKESMQYFVSKDVIPVFNNLLSKTLYNNEYIGPAYKTWMTMANTLNQFQLGVSGFHFGFESMETVIAKHQQAMRAVIDGNYGDAVKFLGEMTIAPWLAIKRGKGVMDAFRGDTSVAADVVMAEMVRLAGGGIGMENRFRTDHTKMMIQHYANKNYIRGTMRLVPAVVEQMARPLMEVIVPRMKFGVFRDRAQYWLKTNEGATQEETRLAMQQLWNRIDSTMGQVRYDRLIVNNTAKNVVQALVRAPGWSGGTLLEIGGGIKDTLKFSKDVLTGKSKDPKVTDRMLYVASLVAVSSVINGVATAMLTGTPPEGDDFWAFRTGGMDERGNPERGTIPTYAKDVGSYSKHFFQTLGNKAHPLLGVVKDLKNNKDFYGVKIRNEDDDSFQQGKDVASYLMSAMMPFAIKGMMKADERGDSLIMKTLPLVGITPASAEMNKTDAQNKMGELLSEHMRVGAKTHAEADKNKLKRDISRDFKLGNDDSASMKIEDALDKGLLSHKDVVMLRSPHNTTTESAIESDFNKLGLNDALTVYRMGNAKEKEQWLPLLVKLRGQADRMAPVDRDRVLERYDSIVTE